MLLLHLECFHTFQYTGDQSFSRVRRPYTSVLVELNYMYVFEYSHFHKDMSCSTIAIADGIRSCRSVSGTSHRFGFEPR